MKVTAIIKGRIDTNGHRPIQIRIFNGKNIYKPTRIKIDPKYFEKGKVKPAHPKAKELNKTLETLIIQYQAQAIKGFDKKQARVDFYQYVNKVLPTLNRASGTVRYYKSQENKLKGFAPALYLDEINKDFLNDYKAYLKTIGNQGNTIWAAFKYLKTFYHLAMRERLISEDPFEQIETITYKDGDKVYLTLEEVKLIDKFIRKTTPALMEAGTWFLIACYTGLRISDIKRFDKKKNIHSGRLVIQTQKTKEMVGLPIDKRLRDYFERVDYKPLSIHDNTYNKLLKVIAAAVGIDKDIASHTARHTAAMLLANAGVSQEVTAKILGHKSLKHTAVYYKISNQRIDQELKKLK